MKILFVSAMPLDYSSSANMRNLALLRGLSENGNELYLLTHESQTELQHYDGTLCDVSFKKKYLLKLSSIHSKATMKKNKKNILKNLIYNFLIKFKIYDFKSSLVSKVKDIKFSESFDLIISSSDPKSSHLLAEEVIKCNPGITKKWIQYWGDPFASDINNKGFVPKSLIKKEEKRLITLADVVVYVSPFTLEFQQKLYPSLKDKMKFLPIPYKLPKVYKEVNNKIKKVGYFGDYFSRNRNVLPLYNAFNNNNFELTICGNSDVELIEKDNIKVFKRQSVKKVEELESQCDLLVCVCNIKGTQIPGKIYHYAATNKPILILLDGNYKDNIKSYLEPFERFIFCSNDENDINEKINYIFENKMKFSPCEKLNCIQIAREFLSFIELSEKND